MDYTIDWSSVNSDIYDQKSRQWLGRTTVGASLALAYEFDNRHPGRCKTAPYKTFLYFYISNSMIFDTRPVRTLVIRLTTAHRALLFHSEMNCMESKNAHTY